MIPCPAIRDAVAIRVRVGAKEFKVPRSDAGPGSGRVRGGSTSVERAGFAFEVDPGGQGRIHRDGGIDAGRAGAEMVIAGGGVHELRVACEVAGAERWERFGAGVRDPNGCRNWRGWWFQQGCCARGSSSRPGSLRRPRPRRRAGRRRECPGCPRRCSGAGPRRGRRRRTGLDCESGDSGKASCWRRRRRSSNARRRRCWKRSCSGTVRRHRPPHRSRPHCRRGGNRRVGIHRWHRRGRPDSGRDGSEAGCRPRRRRRAALRRCCRESEQLVTTAPGAQ